MPNKLIMIANRSKLRSWRKCFILPRHANQNGKLWAGARKLCKEDVKITERMVLIATSIETVLESAYPILASTVSEKGGVGALR